MNFLNKLLSSKFSKDTLWLGGAQVVLVAAGFILNFFLGYARGAEELGLFSQSIAIYNVVVIIAGLGLNNNLLNKIPSHDGGKDDILNVLGQNLAITALFSLLLSLLLFLSAVFIPEIYSSLTLAEVLAYNTLALPLYAINRNSLAYFGAVRAQKRVAQIRVLRWTSLLLVMAIELWFDLALKYLMLSFLASELIVFLVSIIWLGIKWMHVNLGAVRSNLSFGLQSLLSEVLSVSNSRAEVLVLGYTLSDNEVGVYSFLVLFVRILYVLSGIFMQNLNPIISKYWAKSKVTQLAKIMKSMFKTSFMLNLPVALVILIGYYLVIQPMDSAFQESYSIMLIALVGTFIFSNFAFAGSVLIMMGKLRANNWRTGILLVMTIFLTYYLSLYFGLVGAALSVSIVGLLSAVLLILFIKRESGIRIF